MMINMWKSQSSPDNGLPLKKKKKKTLKLYDIIIVNRSVFNNCNKCYSQVCLDD